ncbi:MAG: U32 family peptidase [Chlorobi bacterium]|nr:U32 family peptidase [Chlorobiota bacterium]
MKNKVELMAPAGDVESVRAAIQGGADAVYFGVKQLNMRARSSHNFSLSSLPEVIGLVHEAGVRAYLTLNTIVYDQEIPVMQRVLNEAKRCGIDAVIISDQAALQYAHELGLEIHLSTQLNISNIQSLKFYAGYAEVVVLARELNLMQIEKITRQIKRENITGPSGSPIRVELFAHGALCMAISGKCYLSLHENNASANRGTCEQTCRKAYVVTEKETGYELEINNEYIMSPKDLATIGFLDRILDTGISVLKIEGRARSPEYVKTTVSCYREAIDAVENGSYNADKVKIWKERLSTVFNRGFWGGYYLGEKPGEWSDRYGSHATRKKVYVGKGKNYFSNQGIAEFIIESESIAKGDEVLIIGPTTGVVQRVVQEVRVDDKPVQRAEKGMIVSIPVDTKIRRSDKLYRLDKTT